MSFRLSPHDEPSRAEFYGADDVMRQVEQLKMLGRPHQSLPGDDAVKLKALSSATSTYYRASVLFNKREHWVHLWQKMAKKCKIFSPFFQKILRGMPPSPTYDLGITNIFFIVFMAKNGSKMHNI